MTVDVYKINTWNKSPHQEHKTKKQKPADYAGIDDTPTTMCNNQNMLKFSCFRLYQQIRI